jgi:hypothetical protein
MAKLRYVNTKFWDDRYIRSLEPEGKLLFVYLITNPLDTLAGAYEISIARIAFDTGIDTDTVEDLLDKFAYDEKIYYDGEWLLVVNHVRHQSTTNPKIKKGVEVALKDCPDWIKHRLSITYDWISHLNLNLNLNSDSNFDSKYRELRVSRGVQGGVRKSQNPVPAKTAPKTDRGSRIPEPFLLTLEMREYAAEKRPNVNVTEETEKFTNYWRAKTGKDATKLDWKATWRNWILNAGGTPNGTHQQQRRDTNVERLKASGDHLALYPTEAELAAQRKNAGDD